jgi:hypothetical protein
MIEYQNRYSQTDEPDEQGRWQELQLKNIRIAWISKHFINENIHFVQVVIFPQCNANE